MINLTKEVIDNCIGGSRSRMVFHHQILNGNTILNSAKLRVGRGSSRSKSINLLISGRNRSKIILWTCGISWALISLETIRIKPEVSIIIIVRIGKGTMPLIISITSVRRSLRHSTRLMNFLTTIDSKPMQLHLMPGLSITSIKWRLEDF